MNKKDFAVKRGRIFTTFTNSKAAITFHQNTLGGVLMVRGADGKWSRL